VLAPNKTVIAAADKMFFMAAPQFAREG